MTTQPAPDLRLGAGSFHLCVLRGKVYEEIARTFEPNFSKANKSKSEERK